MEAGWRKRRRLQKWGWQSRERKKRATNPTDANTSEKVLFELVRRIIFAYPHFLSACVIPLALHSSATQTRGWSFWTLKSSLPWLCVVLFSSPRNVGDFHAFSALCFSPLPYSLRAFQVSASRLLCGRYIPIMRVGSLPQRYPVIPRSFLLHTGIEILVLLPWTLVAGGFDWVLSYFFSSRRQNLGRNFTWTTGIVLSWVFVSCSPCMALYVINPKSFAPCAQLLVLRSMDILICAEYLCEAYGNLSCIVFFLHRCFTFVLPFK